MAGRGWLQADASTAIRQIDTSDELIFTAVHLDC